mgnify:CR=1 FL=1
MNIAVVGTGYVGLVTGTCFAETGNHVICVDINEEKVNMMKAGKVPIYEPHLDVLFERNIRQGRLHFTTDLADALEKAQIVFLALPTPPGEDGSADLSYVLNAAADIGKLMTDYKVLVDKSTVPVGTAEKVTAEVKKHAKVDFDVVSNPEFLREGFAVDDFLKPDRVVVGTTSERATGAGSKPAKTTITTSRKEKCATMAIRLPSTATISWMYNTLKASSGTSFVASSSRHSKRIACTGRKCGL